MLLLRWLVVSFKDGCNSLPAPCSLVSPRLRKVKSNSPPFESAQTCDLLATCKRQQMWHYDLIKAYELCLVLCEHLCLVFWEKPDHWGCHAGRKPGHMEGPCEGNPSLPVPAQMWTPEWAIFHAPRYQDTLWVSLWVFPTEARTSRSTDKTAMLGLFHVSDLQFCEHSKLFYATKFGMICYGTIVSETLV